jgi:hypothetical protein
LPVADRSTGKRRGGDTVDERLDPWEHDAGPTTASGWAALIAETPNYLQ